MPKRFGARMNVTYSTNVTVEAETEEEARTKLENGDWLFDQTDGPVDWDDPAVVYEED